MFTPTRGYLLFPTCNSAILRFVRLATAIVARARAQVSSPTNPQVSSDPLTSICDLAASRWGIASDDRGSEADAYNTSSVDVREYSVEMIAAQYEEAFLHFFHQLRYVTFGQLFYHSERLSRVSFAKVRRATPHMRMVSYSGIMTTSRFSHFGWTSTSITVVAGSKWHIDMAREQNTDRSCNYVSRHTSALWKT